MESEGFRRSLRGYDPDEVDHAIHARDARLVRLETEAQQLARRVIETEERLQALLSSGVKGAPPAAAMAVGRIEEIYAQARRQATRIRMKALEDAVQIADRVSELTKLRDELGARVSELAGRAGIQVRIAEAPNRVRPVPDRQEATARPEVPPGSVTPAADGAQRGSVELDVGPLGDFAELSGFEDAVRRTEGVTKVELVRFSRGCATLALELSGPVDLASALAPAAPAPFTVADSGPERIVLHVRQDAEHRRAA